MATRHAEVVSVRLSMLRSEIGCQKLASRPDSNLVRDHTGRIAADAVIDAVGVAVRILAGVRDFGVFLARHAEGGPDNRLRHSASDLTTFAARRRRDSLRGREILDAHHGGAAGGEGSCGAAAKTLPAAPVAA